MPLSRHSVGTYQETSSHATHQGTLVNSRPSSLSSCGLILVSTTETERARTIGISQLVERGTRHRKVTVQPSAETAGEFSSLELTDCVDSYSVSVPPPCYHSAT